MDKRKNEPCIDPSLRIGLENYNHFGSLMIISDYRNYKDIDIYFPEYDYTRTTTFSDFKKGKPTCPFEPTVFNIGYLGDTGIVTKENGKMTLEYEKWSQMLRRCCCEKEKEKYSTYNNCFVNEEWYCFKNYRDWHIENYYEVPGEIMHLDKDLLIKGNKEYGPNTCCFLPQRINSIFRKTTNIQERSDRPGKYRVVYNKMINGKSKRIDLGTFNDRDKAVLIYKEAKEAYIKEVADEYIEYLPTHVYEAMYNWEVDIDD